MGFAGMWPATYLQYLHTATMPNHDVATNRSPEWWRNFAHGMCKTRTAWQTKVGEFRGPEKFTVKSTSLYLFVTSSSISTCSLSLHPSWRRKSFQFSGNPHFLFLSCVGHLPYFPALCCFCNLLP